jgi:hypothetical protein
MTTGMEGEKPRAVGGDRGVELEEEVEEGKTDDRQSGLSPAG